MAKPSMNKSKAVIDELLSIRELFLYGQADYVARVRTYLLEIMPQVALAELVFPLQEKRPEKTVFDFSLHEGELAGLDRAMPIFVVLAMSWHAAAREQLLRLGFSQVIYYTADMENALKRRYFAQVLAREGRAYNDIYTLPATRVDDGASVCIYMTRCVVDKPLQSAAPVLPAEVVPIQAGAALTGERIAAVTDDTGENISVRNRRYSELTAAYWAWKNSMARYIGLSHYRRLFVAPEKIAAKLRTTDIEAVLPLPTLYLDTLAGGYVPLYIPAVYPVMLQVLREMHPEYAADAEQVFGGRYFYGNNMWILRCDVLDDFFGWMFPMLFEIERRIGDLPDPYYNRYAGFCSELLTTLYFWCNKRGWKVAHAEKVFLS